MDARVRPARPSDKKPLMDFIKDVWGGHDYIPDVWDSWLKDPRGKMFVVEADGVPVGMNRVKFLEDGSAWLEGVRVHPGFRGRGLATMLGENSMKVARGRGIKAFRLTSSSRNRTAHRQIARIGFRETTRISVYEAPKGRGRAGTKGAVKVGVDGLSEAIELIRRSSDYRAGGGVFWHNFTAAALDPAVVRGLVEEGAVWRFGSAAAVTRKGGEDGEDREEYCFVGGPVDDALTLIDSVLGWNMKATVRWIYVPQKSPLTRALRARGFKRRFALILFERRSANG